jgi:hypothetical protein
MRAFGERIAARQLDPAARLDTIDDTDVNVVRADDFHMLANSGYVHGYLHEVLSEVN